MGTKYTNPPSPKVLARLLDRYSILEMSKKYRIGRKTLVRWMNEMPRPRRTPRKIPPRPERDELKGHLESEPIWRVCQIYDVGDDVMRAWRTQLGLTDVRSLKQATKHLNNHDYDLMRELADDGMTYTVIAEKFECSVTHVRTKVQFLRSLDAID